MIKKQLDKVLLDLEKELEFEARDNKEYKVKAIVDSAIYSQQANDSNQMPGFYYLVLWKGYPKEENIWEPLLVVIYLWKLISTFYKEHPEKSIAISLLLDFALPMARSTIPKELKQKHNYLSKGANKRSRN